MPVAASLWDRLRDLFETDDGSLPEIRVGYVDREATARGYALLRGLAQHVLPANASFWSKTENRERSLDSVSNAAALVVAGEAEAFHVVFQGIQSHGITLPDLGAFVFPDQLALDYRMGPEWGPGEVEALFALLSTLASFDSETSLSLEEGTPPEVVARFQVAWRGYVEEHAA